MQHKRDPLARSIDFMVAYGCGPTRLGQFPSAELSDCAARWANVRVYSLEAALQNRIDEEGCSAIFTTLKTHLWENLA